MPMNKNQRAKHVEAFKTVAATPDAVQARRLAKMARRTVKMAARQLDLFDNAFQGLSGDTRAKKQITFFDAIAAEKDGSLILHDLGELLDNLTVIINDNKEDGIDDVVPSFTDADVTAYLV